MKKSIYILIFAATLFQVASAQYSDKPKRFHIDAGLTVIALSEHVRVGGGAGFGYFVAENHLLSLDFNGGTLESEKIDKFDYFLTYTDGTTKTFTDGEILRKSSIGSTLVSYHYVLGNYQSRFRWRFGGGAGIRTISASDDYSPEYVEGVKIDNIPKDRHKDSSATPVAAVSAGIRWHFTRAFFADFNYRVILGSSTTVDMKDYSGMTHLFKLSAGFRF
ncbi:MAG: hypothetical protein LBS01_08550 [Prevotellaceae bacterium]|jgi:hypothetical protein|nr:hypothetical protein [Prevotellaceae bacterium]